MAQKRKLYDNKELRCACKYWLTTCYSPLSKNYGFLSRERKPESNSGILSVIVYSLRFYRVDRNREINNVELFGLSVNIYSLHITRRSCLIFHANSDAKS